MKNDHLSDQDPTNIECFEYAAAALLAHLYGSFPRPVMVKGKEMEERLAKATMIPRACLWEECKGRPHESLVSSTLLWLCEEGLVRHHGESAGRFNGVVLTAKGFAALNSPVLPDDERETYGQRIARFSKDSILSGISSTIAGLVTTAARNIITP